MDKRVVCVADGNDPRVQGNLLAPEPIRITAPIEPFVVVANDWQHVQAGAQRPHNLGSDHRMCPHLLQLIGVKRSGFPQDGVVDTDLAYVVNHPPAIQRVQLGLG